MFLTRLAIFIWISCAALILLVDGAAGLGPPTHELAFARLDGSGEEITLVEAETGFSFDLTRHPALDYRPRWSPDGAYLAFISERDDRTPALFVMRADGHDLHRVNSVRIASPFFWSWAPAGRRLVFVGQHDTDGERNIDLFVVDVDAGTETRLTTDRHSNFQPVWSPDGTRVAYVSDRSWPGSHIGDDLYLINADGSGSRLLYGAPDYDGDIHWLPDGDRVLFYSRGVQDGLYFIFDIANQTLERAPGSGGWAWAPDGALAYVAERFAGARLLSDLFLHVGGDAPVNLSAWLELSGRVADPQWSPGADRLAFVLGEGDDRDIFLLAAARTPAADNLTNISALPGGDFSPQWSSDGAFLAFASDHAVPPENRRFDAVRLYLTRADGTAPYEAGNADVIGEITWRPVQDNYMQLDMQLEWNGP